MLCIQRPCLRASQTMRCNCWFELLTTALLYACLLAFCCLCAGTITIAAIASMPCFAVSKESQQVGTANRSSFVMLQEDIPALERQLEVKNQQLTHCQARLADREARVARAAQGDTQTPATLKMLVSGDVRRVVRDTASGSGSAERKVKDQLVLWHPGQTSCNVSSPIFLRISFAQHNNHHALLQHCLGCSLLDMK